MTQHRCETCGRNHDGTANSRNACEPIPDIRDLPDAASWEGVTLEDILAGDA